MSWDAWTNNLQTANPDVILAAAIWGKEDKRPWTSSNPCFPLTEADVQILVDKYKEFCSCGPKLLGTKFVMTSNGMEDKQIKTVTLKTMCSGPDAYHIVYGFSTTAVLICKVSGQNARGAINPIFTMINQLCDHDC